jgi:S1-C subfamily serine protease
MIPALVITVALTAPPDTVLLAATSACKVGVGHERYTDWGSGVLIDGDRVLTARHVVGREGVDVTCYWHQAWQSPSAAGRVEITSQWDVAVIQLTRSPPHVTPLPLAEANPPIGTDVWSIGYPGRRRRGLCRSGAVDGYVTNKHRGPLNWIDVRAKRLCAHPGDSGGPLLNASGEIVGLIWGGQHDTTRTESTAAAVGIIHEILDSETISP